MQKIVCTILALAAGSSLALAQNRPTRFWNLTRYAVSEFHLAPAGTTNFGPNQCKNDKDGTKQVSREPVIAGDTAAVQATRRRCRRCCRRRRRTTRRGRSASSS